MEFSAEQIAGILGGTVEGNPKTPLETFAKIEEAGPRALTFLANPKYSHHLYTSRAGAVLIARDYELQHPVETTLIRVDDPYAALAQLMRMVDELTRPRPRGVEQPSFVAKGVTVPDDAYIGAFAYVGERASLGAGVQIHPQAYVGPGVSVGEGTIVYPGAKIYHGCRIGARCIIHAGAVIGADGFGFAPNPDGTYSKIPQLGRVEIADDVEIGANTTIDRATMGHTAVGRGTKLDNLIQVAHNVEIGENTVMASQVGIAGSTKVGSNCMVGGQVGMAGHIRIGDRVNIGAQSGLHTNIADDRTIMGTPAADARQWFRQMAYLGRIAELFSRVNALEKEMKKQEKND